MLTFKKVLNKMHTAQHSVLLTACKDRKIDTFQVISQFRLKLQFNQGSFGALGSGQAHCTYSYIRLWV